MDGVLDIETYSGDITIPGHKPERNPYGTLPKRLSDFCPVTVQCQSIKRRKRHETDVDRMEYLN